MPATAGRVRMPANNRVHSSAALQTHGIWQSAIGYDPYAPKKKDDNGSWQPKPDAENAYASFQGLLALARVTGQSNADETRGACKRCGRVGHLTYQCKNLLSLKEDKEKEPEGFEADVACELIKLERKLGKTTSGNNVAETESEEDSEDEESESSDSEYDSEIERIIAERSGKKFGRKEKSTKKNEEDSDRDRSDTDSGKRKKRGRSKKRRSSKRKYDHDSDDSDEGRKKRRGEKPRKSSRKEKRRRRSSHRHSDESDSSDDDSHRYSSRRSRKRSEKKSRKRHHDDE